MFDIRENHHGYLLLLIFSIIVTFFSLIVEFNYPFMGDSHIYSLVQVILYRILHYYITLYNSTFLLWFKTDGIDSIIYLIFNLIMNIQWSLIGCCWLSFFELNEYSNINYKNYDTTFNPFMHVFFRGYSGYIMKIIGLIIIFTIFTILYNNKHISLHYKVLYLILFSYSINVCANGDNPIWDWLSNINTNEDIKVFEMKKILEKVESFNRYPKEDHFLFKYLCKKNNKNMVD
jgi:hypothetical protein